MYGYGYGRGKGWGRGMAGGGGWRGPGAATSPAVQPPAGYRHVGACRCGLGPNAHYQDPAGRVVPAAVAFSGPGASEPQESELERLRAETSDIERRLHELEDRLRGTA